MITERCPKSVSGCIAPPDAGIAQILAVAPSINETASHLPSGESTGLNIVDFTGTRSPATRARISGAPDSGRALSSRFQWLADPSIPGLV